jgi:NitT/TauT family transport system permease protein
VAIVLAIWQATYAAHWRPDYVLPSPGDTLRELGHELTTQRVWTAIGITARRAIVGFALAVVVGTLLGLAVSRSRVLRAGVGSLVTGLQTMPSIAWFPLALLVFSYTERAITFVVVLGAAPSVANGIIAGVDHVPPPLLRAARTMGAHGFGLYRHVVMPAALPTYVSGLKQGWAFAWRSLMAGELLVIIAHRPSLGVLLDFDRQNSDAASMIAIMIVILAIGMVVDIVFNAVDRGLRRRRGLIVES